MKVLVLGATGFVGKNVCDDLSAVGLTVVKAPPRKTCDLRDMDSTIALLNKAQPDYLVNCAAQVGSLNYVTNHAGEVITNNARMILNIYEAIKNLSLSTRVISLVANCAYPATTMEAFKEDEWQNGPVHSSVFAYGSVRRFTWAVSKCYEMQYGTETITLLVPNMYGPGDSTDPDKAHALNALISKFLRAKRNGEKSVSVWGTGAPVREWLYVKDFSRIVVHIVREGSDFSEPVNIAQNYGVSIKDLVELIRHDIGFAGDVVYDTTKVDGAPKKVMDDKRFKDVFPSFKFTPFEVGIPETIQYYRKFL